MNVFLKRMSVSYENFVAGLPATLLFLVMMASASAQAESFPGSFANLAEKLLPAVVNISSLTLDEPDKSKSCKSRKKTNGTNIGKR